MNLELKFFFLSLFHAIYFNFRRNYKLIGQNVNDK